MERLFAAAPAQREGAPDDCASADGVSTALLRAALEGLKFAVRGLLLDKPKYAQLERDARRLFAELPRLVADAAALRDLERAAAEFLQAAADRVAA